MNPNEERELTAEEIAINKMEQKLFLLHKSVVITRAIIQAMLNDKSFDEVEIVVQSETLCSLEASWSAAELKCQQMDWRIEKLS